jgi:hypothetical protein
MMNLQEKSSSTDLNNIDFTFLPSDYSHASVTTRCVSLLRFFFLRLPQVSFPSFVGIKGNGDKAELVIGR